MLIGTFYYVLLFFSIKSEAISGYDQDNMNMRIGIFYGSKITCSVRLNSETGFDVGYTDPGGRNYIDEGDIPQTDIYVSRHVNLTYNGTMYVKAKDASSATVGCYHIDILSDKDYLNDIALIKQAFPQYNVFPALINFRFHVFVGQFATIETAEAALSQIKAAVTPPTPPESSEGDTTDIPEDTSAETDTSETSSSDTSAPESTDASDTTVPETDGPKETEPEYIPPIPDEALTAEVLAATIHTPQDQSIAVIETGTHNILWVQFDGAGKNNFLIGPKVVDPDGRTFMYAYHGTTRRKYDGYFEFTGLCPAEYYGVRGINVVRLENYIVGVCSAEIPTWWPMETIKAFSIAVRNYALRTLYGHGEIGADLCNTADCQVFNGYGPAEERVWQAVAETRGIIAVSNGVICGTYYSSSTGGCTANCTDVWGSSLATYPYLKAVATPWEKYTTYRRGQKTTTVTGTALYNKLKDKGYTGLSGPVTSVKITKTGNNTTYVTEIKFYDAKGNCVTVNRADRIKRLLADYIDSSNFVVVKSGETAVRTNYTMLGFGAYNPNPAVGLDIKGNPNKYTVFGRQLFSVVTSSGTKTFYDSNAEKVATANGIVDFNMAGELDSQVYPTVIGINGEVLPDINQLTPIVESESITTTYQADSFTFISRGWGHGVGMSQYGIYELGNLGYDYLTILKAYYTGIQYTTYKEYIN